MKLGEKSYLVSKKFKEGKSEVKVFKEIKDLDDSKIIFREKQREINNLRYELEKKDKTIKQLKKKLFDMGLKLESNKEKVNPVYFDKPFPNEKEIRRVRIILRSEPRGLDIREINKLAYGISLSTIRDCLLFLNATEEVITRGDKYIIVK